MTSEADNRGRAGRRDAGMTLIEVLAGALIVGMVMVAATWSVSQAARSKVALAESPVNAALLAREIYELALGQSTADDGSPPATNAAGVAGLDSLDGAVFMPPIKSTGATVPHSERWKQVVSVSVWDMADLSAPASEGFVGAAQTGTSLFRLTVTVLNNNQEMGTWWWWINP